MHRAMLGRPDEAKQIIGAGLCWDRKLDRAADAPKLVRREKLAVRGNPHLIHLVINKFHRPMRRINGAHLCKRLCLLKNS